MEATQMGSSDLPKPSIETLLLADYAESVNGKLYVSGGGFANLFMSSFERPGRFYYGALLSVPWNDTNRLLPIEGQVESVDGEKVEASGFRGQLEFGRPAGVTPGTPLVIAFAGPVEFVVEEQANLLFRFRFGEDEQRRRFHVRPGGGGF
jgi:hypothetical protein